MFVKMTDENPPKYGRYKVLRRGPGRKIYEDELLWNGDSFVTHRNSLTKAIEAWWKDDNNA